MDLYHRCELLKDRPQLRDRALYRIDRVRALVKVRAAHRQELLRLALQAAHLAHIDHDGAARARRHPGGFSGRARPRGGRRAKAAIIVVLLVLEARAKAAAASKGASAAAKAAASSACCG